MCENNLLDVQQWAFTAATDYNHEIKVYLNLASRLTLTGLNQLWVADITLHSSAHGVRLSGRDSRWLLPQGRELGVRQDLGDAVATGGLASGHHDAPAPARRRASF